MSVCINCNHKAEYLDEQGYCTKKVRFNGETTECWCPKYVESTRETRSEGLEFTKVSEGRFRVKSQSTPGKFYQVKRIGGSLSVPMPSTWTCDCMDNETREVECKHIIRARRSEPIVVEVRQK